MATYTILSSVVQGLPAVVTLDGSTTIVSHSGSVTQTQVGTGYFYKGAVVDQTQISASQTVINTLLGLGAIG